MKKYLLVFGAVIACICAGVYFVLPSQTPLVEEGATDGTQISSFYNGESTLTQGETDSYTDSAAAHNTTDALTTSDEGGTDTGLPAAGFPGSETTTSDSLTTTQERATLWHPQEAVTAPKKTDSAELAVVERIIFAFGFEYDNEQGIFYSSVEPWQKNFGFNEIYDFFARFGAMIYETKRFKFNYNDKDWMLQVWKGRYGITTGCEMGVYYKNPEQTAEFYVCVEEEDFIAQEFFVYKDNEPYMFRGPEKHWWLTGFKLGEIYYAEDLFMVMTYYLDNELMADALEEAIAREGFIPEQQSAGGYFRDKTAIQIYW